MKASMRSNVAAMNQPRRNVAARGSRVGLPFYPFGVATLRQAGADPVKLPDGGPLRMVRRRTWSGRERSSHSRAEPVPKSGSPLLSSLGTRCPCAGVMLSPSPCRFPRAAGMRVHFSIPFRLSSAYILNDVSGSGTQVAATFVRYPGRSRSRGARTDTRPGYPAAAPCLAVHGDTRGGQDHAVAHPCQIPEL